jgi:hypothetical protein
LRVTEGVSVDTATATYEISNVAPVATVQFSGPIVAGTPATVKLGANDPSPTDQAGQFEYRVDWDGDGVIDDVLTGSADPPATHTYASAGNVGLSVIAVDKDGAASDPTVSTVTVSPASSETTTTTPGTSTGTTSGAALARTGDDIATTGRLAVLLVLAGMVLTATTRRRRGSL